MTDAPSENEIRQRVKQILRRDLKLGPDAPIADDMRLVGGDYELDSLDVVLMITSVEKEFGVKIRNSGVGQEAFKSVDTLVRFIHEQAANGSVGGAAEGQPAAEQAVDLDRWLAMLPHGEPFRFVTRLEKLVPRQQGEGAWEITGNEAFFAGHFPDRPVVPGVLISEALAQLAGLVGADADEPNRTAQLAHVDLRFLKPVEPPATLSLYSRLTQDVQGLQHFEARASDGETAVAEGRLVLKRN